MVNVRLPSVFYTSIKIIMLLIAFGCSDSSKEPFHESGSNHKIDLEFKAEAGGYSGGGGFITRNSRLILNRVANDLYSEIDLLPNSVFDGLPSPFNKPEILRIIDDLKKIEFQLVDEVVEINGVHLEFDFRVSNGDALVRPSTMQITSGNIQPGQSQIIVTKTFFNNYSNVPIFTLNENDEDYLNIFKRHGALTNTSLSEVPLDLRYKILHELGHFIFPSDSHDIAEERARKFSQSFMDALTSHGYICEYTYCLIRK